MSLATLPPSAVAFIVAGVAFLGYGVLTARGGSSRRVDALRPAPSRRNLIAAAAAARRAPAVFRAASGAAPGRMAVELARRFRIAPQIAARLLLPGRVVLGIVGAVVLVPLLFGLHPEPSPQLVFVGICGFAVGVYAPMLALSMLANKRLRAIEQGLPEAIELLVIAVEAGLALDDAIDRIVGELFESQPEVAEEMALTSADLKILPNREAALGKFAERVDLPSVKSFVNTLSQTMRYGTPLAQALRVVAGELRNDELMRVEENANRMPVMLTIPMVIFMLPSLFLIIGGPTVLKLVRLLFH
jgi:tight adherence protein C